MSDSLQPHGLQHARILCLSPTPGACSNSCPSCQRCYPTISSSAAFFSFGLQSFPATGSFLVSQLFTPDGQTIGASASASVLSSSDYSRLISFRIDWFDLLPVKGLSKLFSSSIVQKHQFFNAQYSLWFSVHICTWLLGKPQLWL